MATQSFLKNPLAADVDLLEKRVEDRPVLWVGAGLSIAAGHPSTGELISAMRDKVDEPIPPDLSFTEVADRFVASQSQGTLDQLLQDMLGKALPETATHSAIARLARGDFFSAIITTNYDDLLERALGNAGCDDYVLQTLGQNEHVRGKRLIKLHGSREDWSRTILSGQSYEDFGHRYEFVLRQLDVLLRQNPIWFIGCSMTDPRVLEWLDKLNQETAAKLKVWYPLLTEKNWRDACQSKWNGGLAEVTLGRARIRPLLLRDHKHLPELFDALADRKSPPPPETTKRIDLHITWREGWTASLEGVDDWQVDNPLDDDAFRDAVDNLRRLDHQPLPTDEQGALAPDAAQVAGQIKSLAEWVGRQLTDRLLTPAARDVIATAVRRTLTGEPAWLHIRVHAPADDKDRQGQGNRLLSLPWELLHLDGEHPVRKGILRYLARSGPL